MSRASIFLLAPSHMASQDGQAAGVPARLARVSCTGELQYEVSVAARYASSLLEALLTLQGELRPRLVGMEAWLRLRLEKGYLHIASDTNGRTTPLDVVMASIVARRPDDFIGKRSLSLAFSTSPECEQLVGLVAIDGALRVGDRTLAPGQVKVPAPTDACYQARFRMRSNPSCCAAGQMRELDSSRRNPTFDIGIMPNICSET
jgi:sarcosine oxidase subunit alpha